MKDFKEKLALVPNKPGSYQMRDKDGVIIYVGKAKNLKNRLKSYFTGTHTGKTLSLVENIDDFGIVNVLFAEAFGEHKPARSTISVNGLPKNAMIMVDAIALAN